MKHLKRFENLNTLEVGDYIVIKTEEDEFSYIYNEFLKTHIGIVLEVQGNVFYANFILNNDDPDYIKAEFCHNQGFNIRHLKYHSKSLEDIKLKIYANKYNL